MPDNPHGGIRFIASVSNKEKGPSAFAEIFFFDENGEIDEGLSEFKEVIGLSAQELSEVAYYHRYRADIHKRLAEHAEQLSKERK
jgi:hypothetical protein